MPVEVIIKEPIVNAWWLFHETHDSVVKCEENLFLKTELPRQQFLVISAIKMCQGPATAAAIANLLDRHPNSMTLIINRMEKDGLIKRVKDLKDRRAIRLVITPRGEEIFTRVSEPARNLPERIFSVLSKKEIIALIRLIRKIREHSFELREVEDKVTTINLNENPNASFLFG
ncbi:MarR family winged helix-turn-helix transcriptional regulator [Chloroflexota bacterium]